MLTGTCARDSSRFRAVTMTVSSVVASVVGRRRRVLGASRAPVERGAASRRQTQKLREEASTRHRLFSRGGRRIGGLMVRIQGLGLLSAFAPRGCRIVSAGGAVGLDSGPTMVIVCGFTNS